MKAAQDDQQSLKEDEEEKIMHFIREHSTNINLRQRLY